MEDDVDTAFVPFEGAEEGEGSFLGSICSQETALGNLAASVLDERLEMQTRRRRRVNKKHFFFKETSMLPDDDDDDDEYPLKIRSTSAAGMRIEKSERS